MRFSILTVVLGSAFAMTLAQTGESEALGTRSEDVVLNARDLLEDLGMHARDLKGATLSVRRIEDLEARMLDLEADLEDLAVRAKVTKSDPFICPVCDETFATRRDLNSHIDLMGHWQRIAPAPARQRSPSPRPGGKRAASPRRG